MNSHSQGTGHLRQAKYDQLKQACTPPHVLRIPHIFNSFKLFPIDAARYVNFVGTANQRT
jgi:hypothetical protein